MKITNTQKGPRGVNAIGGAVLVDPEQTVEVDVYAREKEHLDASGWFTIKGEYTPNPDGSASATADKSVPSDSAEIEALKKQLADRDAELAKLKAAGTSEREDLKKQAAELGLDYAPNIGTAKLKELIDAKLAS
ncbi:hypothetical protein [Pararhizobium sp.]|uniref:hypothetical protein n=1 Tax=Pararhizobium sp. TaxID=1977563 RepID=UPI002718927E|nr:hypothetical protein [Pararhizobium sp.]MDO9417028.1 hypothetical protein [Pararhizobium sp.]